MYVIIGLLLPCFLAGMRANFVGTDIQGYVEPMFEAAQLSKNLVDYYLRSIPYGYTYRAIGEYEIGFTTMLYCITKIFGNIQMVLFFIQVVTIVPIYRGLRSFSLTSEKCCVWLGMLTYYLFFYNVSLNLMRQWIATGILVYAISFLLDSRYKNFFFYVVIASLFHRAVLLGLLMGVIHYYLYRKNPKKIKFVIGKVKIKENTLKISLIIGMCIFSLLIFDIFAIILSKIGLGNYSSYLGDGVIFSLNQVILRLPVFVGIFLARKKLRNEKKYLVLIVMLIIEFFVAQLSKSSTYAYRIAMYFSSWNIYSYPLVFSSWRNKFIGRLFVIFILLVYWYYMFVYKVSNETIPYAFFLS